MIQADDYSFDASFLKSVQTLDPRRTYGKLAFAWLTIFLVIFSIRFYFVHLSFFWFFYPLILFLIASRQGVLLNILHEGSHNLISKDKKKNDWVSLWLCGLPIGVEFEGFRYGHINHHAYTGPASDTEPYQIACLRWSMIYLMFLKDFFGLTALKVFGAYETKQSELKSAKKSIESKFLIKFVSLCFAQAIVLGVLFQFDILDYILFWLVPAITAHMFLMRIRGIAEHGLLRQFHTSAEHRDEGGNLTRSFLTPAKCYSSPLLVWLEKLLIGSVGIYYHHEHHILPGVPFYHLAKVHASVSKQLKDSNPDLHKFVYQTGYFSAFFGDLKHARSSLK